MTKDNHVEYYLRRPPQTQVDPTIYKGLKLIGFVLYFLVAIVGICMTNVCLAVLLIRRYLSKRRIQHNAMTSSKHGKNVISTVAPTTSITNLDNSTSSHRPMNTLDNVTQTNERKRDNMATLQIPINRCNKTLTIVPKASTSVGMMSSTETSGITPLKTPSKPEHTTQPHRPNSVRIGAMETTSIPQSQDIHVTAEWELKTTKMVTAVTTIFIACVFPTFVIFPIQTFGGLDIPIDNILFILPINFLLESISYSMNAVVYDIGNSAFRKEVHDILNSICPCLKRTT